MDGTYELRSVIECHTGTPGSKMRIEHVADAFPVRNTTEKHTFCPDYDLLY